MHTLLQINVTANQGSTGRIAEEIGQTAIKNGWSSYIAYGRYKNISQSHLIKIGNRWNIYVHVLFTRIFDFHGLLSKRATRKLIHKIKEISPDIIHLHNIHGYYINYPILFKYLKKSGIPVVWTFHDCWSFTGHCAHFESVHCEKWISQCEKCPLKKTYPASCLFDRSKKNYKDKKKYFNSIDNLTIVPVSRWLENKVKCSFLKENKIKMIYNGIDLSLFKPTYNKNLIASLSIKDKFVLLAVAASWSASKGLYDYYELSKKINKDEVLILVGLTQKQLKNLPAGIIGLERTESVKKLAVLYTMADIVLNLSYAEALGLTTIEGLACGTPSIVYNATASPELITEETGAIVEPSDIKGVLSSIKKIKMKGSQSYAINCRKEVVERFNKEDRYNDYINLYNQILSKNN